MNNQWEGERLERVLLQISAELREAIKLLQLLVDSQTPSFPQTTGIKVTLKQ